MAFLAVVKMVHLMTKLKRNGRRVLKLPLKKLGNFWSGNVRINLNSCQLVQHKAGVPNPIATPLAAYKKWAMITLPWGGWSHLKRKRFFHRWRRSKKSAAPPQNYICWEFRAWKIWRHLNALGCTVLTVPRLSSAHLWMTETTITRSNAP